jgi:hypothetical protein
VLVLLIALGVVGLALRLLSAESDQLTLAGVRPIDSDTVDKVVMRDSLNEIIINKVGGVWQAGPYPVVAAALEDMWETAELFDDEAELISNNPDNHILMGVAQGNATVVQFWQGDKLYEEFLVGDKVYAPVEGLERVFTPWTNVARLCYLRRPGADEVYGVFCRFPDRFRADPRFWAEPSIVQIPRDEVEVITFSYPGESFDLRAINSVWVVVSEGSPETASLEVTLALLTELEALVTSDFPDASDVAELDFAQPDVLLGIGTREGATASPVLLLFLETADGAYYVKDAENGWVYFLNAEDAARVLKTRQDFTAADTPATSG